MQNAMNGAQAHIEPDYMKIFWWLLGLTIFEVAILYMHLPHGILAAALILTAIIKALLVAMNFMHLRFEKWTLIVLPTLAILLILDLFIGLMPDIAHVHF